MVSRPACYESHLSSTTIQGGLSNSNFPLPHTSRWGSGGRARIETEEGFIRASRSYVPLEDSHDAAKIGYSIFVSTDRWQGACFSRSAAWGIYAHAEGDIQALRAHVSQPNAQRERVAMYIQAVRCSEVPSLHGGNWLYAFALEKLPPCLQMGIPQPEGREAGVYKLSGVMW